MHPKEHCAGCGRRQDKVGRLKATPDGAAEPRDTPHLSAFNRRVCSACSTRIRRAASPPPAIERRPKRKRGAPPIEQSRSSPRQRGGRWAATKATPEIGQIRRANVSFSKSLLNGGTNQLSQLSPALKVVEQLDALRAFKSGDCFLDIGCSVCTLCSRGLAWHSCHRR